MLIVDVIFAINVKIQKSRNSSRQVDHVDKLKVRRGETPKSWLPVDMYNDTVTEFKDEPKDVESKITVW